MLNLRLKLRAERELSGNVCFLLPLCRSHDVCSLVCLFDLLGAEVFLSMHQCMVGAEIP